MSAADRREAILDAARTAFADTGYHETSLDAVAERAGVSKALLYEHFSSKRELYVAMLEMHVHELVERIAGAVAGAEPGEPRMRAGLEAFFGFVEERRGAWRIMFRNAGDPDVAIRLDRLRDEVAAAIVQLMSEEAERSASSLISWTIAAATSSRRRSSRMATSGSPAFRNMIRQAPRRSSTNPKKASRPARIRGSPGSAPATAPAMRSTSSWTCISSIAT